MASRTIARTFTRLPTRLNTSAKFSTSSRSFVKIGDSLPDLDVLVENSPGNKVNLGISSLAKGKGLIIGVPAAFSRFDFHFPVFNSGGKRMWGDGALKVLWLL